MKWISSEPNRFTSLLINVFFLPDQTKLTSDAVQKTVETIFSVEKKCTCLISWWMVLIVLIFEITKKSIDESSNQVGLAKSFLHQTILGKLISVSCWTTLIYLLAILNWRLQCTKRSTGRTIEIVILVGWSRRTNGSHFSGGKEFTELSWCGTAFTRSNLKSCANSLK